MIYSLLADLILIIHTVFIAFVVFGLVFILIGGLRHWRWIRFRLFRLLHLAAIGIVVVQSWLGMICPLTIWEMQLRAKAGQDTYEGSFIAHWLHQLIFFEAPEWVFILAYTMFGALVVVSWFCVPPNKKSHHN